MSHAIKSLIIFNFIFIIPAFLFGNTCNHDKSNFRCVKYIKNYDGDTITFNIPSIHPLFGDNISVRVLGIDTPEIKTKDKCEKDQANKAKAIVHEILTKAKRIDLMNVQRGKYFRIVADVIADGVSVSKILIDSGLAYKYFGKTKQKVNWCEVRQRAPANAN